MKKIEHLSDLTPDLKNANKGSERGQHLIEESLRQYGAGRSILIDKNGVIMAGNKTAENFGAIGLDDVIVVQTDGTKLVAVQRTDLDMMADPRARELAIADNRASEVSLDWNADVLKELGEEIDLMKFWSADELAALLPPVTADLLTDEDDVPPVPDEPKSKLGDLYRLGDHRLLCGDSTCVTDVEKLMDGQKADMVFTDPPYGVDYEGGHFHSGDVNIKRPREKLAQDNDASIYADFLPVMLQVVDGPCYMWFAHSKAHEVFGPLHDNDCIVSAVLIWHKTNATYAAMNSQYKQRHEPCVYFKPKGSTLRWCGSSTESTLWEEKKEGANTLHPTQKPVCLAERAIGNHKANIILDLFGGSGSTLIACEKTGRRCYMMELSPAYCDVIVARWEAATGKKAELV
jgi:DNA modification methylase